MRQQQNNSNKFHAAIELPRGDAEKHRRPSRWRMQCLSHTGGICLTRLSYSFVISVSESKSEIRGGDDPGCFYEIGPFQVHCCQGNERDPNPQYPPDQTRNQARAKHVQGPNRIRWAMGDAKNPDQKHVTSIRSRVRFHAAAHNTRTIQ